jgi:hypothetical protein
VRSFACNAPRGAKKETTSQVDVKGFDSTVGFTQWANKPAKQDAPVHITSLPHPTAPSFFAINSSSPPCAQPAPS